jgi:hypothetical protein
MFATIVLTIQYHSLVGDDLRRRCFRRFGQADEDEERQGRTRPTEKLSI